MVEIGQFIESDIRYTDNQNETKIDSQKLAEKILAINKNTKAEFLTKPAKKGSPKIRKRTTTKA